MTTTPIDHDHLCVSCGYNLRGLAVDSNCPECATPVAESMKGDFLAFAGARYRRRLLVSLLIITLGVAATALIGVSRFFFGFVFSALGPSGFAGAQTAVSIILVVPNAMVLTGAWLLVTPDPGYNGQSDPSRARLWTRVGVILEATRSVAGMMVWMVPGVSAAMTAGVAAAVLTSLGIVRTCLSILVCCATVRYVRWVADRVPNVACSRRAERRVWSVGLLVATSILMPFGNLSLMRPSLGAPFWLFSILSFVSWVCWTIAMILYVHLLMSVRREVLRVHETSRQVGAGQPE